MPANLRLVWNAATAATPKLDKLHAHATLGYGAGSPPKAGERFDIYEHDMVWARDEDNAPLARDRPARADYIIRTDTHRPLLLPPPHPRAHVEPSRPALITDENVSTYTASTTPHPYSSPQERGVRFAPTAWRKRRSRLNFRKPRGPSLRALTALAILIAGLVIMAQALFIPTKAQAAQFLMERAWDHRLATGEATRPWPWADFTPAARLTFPSQHRSVLALTDAAGESLAFGPTLMAASVQPGESGVSVIAAHRDTHFAFLDRLQPGQLVEIETPGKKLAFKVVGSSVVPWNASGVRPHDGGGARIALVTCWPLDSKFRGPMRYVVWAEMVETAPSV